MLTALCIEEYSRKGIVGLFHLLRHNRIRVEHLYCDSVAVKSIVYEHRRGKISWTAIDRFVRTQRGQVLCTEQTALPAQSGYRRFVGSELSRRMCENAALYLLQEAGGRPVRVALVDDSGESIGLCTYLTDCTDCLLVNTRARVMRLYLHEADRMLEERGAAIRVVPGGCDLSGYDLIIAPAALQRDVRCAADAVVLSGEAPRVRQNAPVIREYLFDLPQKYRDVMPPYLDEMYFASALYSLGGVHELGSSVFRRCWDGRVLHTRASLLELLQTRLNAAEKTAAKS